MIIKMRQTLSLVLLRIGFDNLGAERSWFLLMLPWAFNGHEVKDNEEQEDEQEVKGYEKVKDHKEIKDEV